MQIGGTSLDAAVVSTEADYTYRIRQGFGHGYDTASILVRVQGASANLIDGLAQEIRSRFARVGC